MRPPAQWLRFIRSGVGRRPLPPPPSPSLALRIRSVLTLFRRRALLPLRYGLCLSGIPVRPSVRWCVCLPERVRPNPVRARAMKDVRVCNATSTRLSRKLLPG
jgi:hypothetical protein